MRCKGLSSRGASVLVAGAVLALGACGSDDAASTTTAVAVTTAATATTPAASTPAAGFAPVTVDHVYGATKIDARPARIVSLDTQWTDVLLALDEQPIGYLGDPNDPGGFPWRGDMLATSTRIDATNTLPFEQIAALQPDLIVITYLATDEAAYQTLAGIAPTIATLSTTAVVDPWPDIVEAAGKVLGEQDAAAALTDQVDAEVASVGDDLPGLHGRTYTFFNVVQGDGIYVLTDPDDGANQLFRDLGLTVAPEVAALGTDVEGGRVKVSFEQSNLLDADLMVYLGNGADVPAVIPGFAELSAVQAGASVELSYADIVGLNTPSPLSIPYSLDKIRPALEVAAA